MDELLYRWRIARLRRKMTPEMKARQTLVEESIRVAAHRPRQFSRLC
jgi:hypothetical protein